MSTKDIEAYSYQRVADWTKHELLNLQRNSRLPICVQLHNGDYLVSTYRVEKVTDICWRVGEYDFADKRSAIFYCAMMHLNKYIEADNLRKFDRLVGKLDLDKSLFRVRLDAAYLNNDEFKIGLYSSRYDEARNHLKIAKKELENLLDFAKYKYCLIGKEKL